MSTSEPPKQSENPGPETIGGLDMKLPSDQPPRKANPSGSAEQEPKKKSLKRRLLEWTIIALAVLLALFFLYRWAGTSEYTGTVQRVYEKQAEYRLEFHVRGGRVRVAANKEIRFPYFKTDTADLHAELGRLARTGDLVKIKVWGFRHSWISMFPNVIDVEFVQSRKERLRARAERLADAIMATLANRDALKKDDPGTREAIVDAIVLADEQRNAEEDEGGDQ